MLLISMSNKNRGMFLEKIINKTIAFYEKQELALFHKKNIDIVFKAVNKTQNSLKLENAFLSKKSTVDYYGIYKGKFIAFEAKSVEGNLLPFKNISQHQMDYLAKIEKYQGVGFLIIFFKTKEKFFYLEYKDFKNYYQKQNSISFEQVQEIGTELELNYPGILDFIDFIKV